ncbi:hypothetical protein D7X33_09075 [Butyricicoccus sp. 1XD8-22]|nr:hypothetical protein D7X33_09075 [Butyricicoccus sp. 1XD8-22]
MKLKNLRKMLALGMLFSVCLSFNVANAACKADIPQNENDLYIEDLSDNTISPHADEIITKFRRYNGVIQYRRWNATKGYWVDPDWIDLP